MNTIIIKEPDHRIKRIFKSTVDQQFSYFQSVNYERLELDANSCKSLSGNGYDWMVFTSLRAWAVLSDILTEERLPLSKSIKIAVFGPETAKQIIGAGRKVDFTTRAKDAVEFISKLINHIDVKSKLLYPASAAAGRGLESCLCENKINYHRINIYEPKGSISSDKINELITSKSPDSFIFFSVKSAEYFFKNCTDEILRYMNKMQFFAIGESTASVIAPYTCHDVIYPVIPNIHDLSDLVGGYSGKVREVDEIDIK